MNRHPISRRPSGHGRSSVGGSPEAYRLSRTTRNADLIRRGAPPRSAATSVRCTPDCSPQRVALKQSVSPQFAAVTHPTSELAALRNGLTGSG